MRKRKVAPIVEETPPPSPAIRGRGASWSPANRFEKLHVDLGDIDVVQTDPDDGWPSLGAASRGEARKPTRRETQFFRDGTKTIITHNNSPDVGLDRKSTRLNSSHVAISYAVFCLKKKKKNK